MTEKRFELIPMDNSHKFFYGLFDNDKNEYVTKDMKLSYAEVICNLLNELNNKNKQLKSELISKDDLIQQLKIKLNMDYYNKWKKCNLKYTEICEELLEENKLYKKLSDENEQLKKKNDNLIKISAMTQIRNDKLKEENEHLKKELKRCRDWLNSDKNDYQLTLAFIKNKGYSLKDVLEYEKELGE